MQLTLLTLALFLAYFWTCSLCMGDVTMYSPSGNYAEQTVCSTSVVPFGVATLKWSIELRSDPRTNRLYDVDLFANLISPLGIHQSGRITLWALPEEKRLSTYR